MSNLVSLLQPKEYKSKIKLYCNNCNFMVKKFGEYEKDSYICRVKIEEI